MPLRGILGFLFLETGATALREWRRASLPAETQTRQAETAASTRNTGPGRSGSIRNYHVNFAQALDSVIRTAPVPTMEVIRRRRCARSLADFLLNPGRRRPMGEARTRAARRMSATAIPVLIVDDDPTVGAVLSGMLRRPEEGFVCAPKWVATAAAALAEVRTGDFKLVLLDYQLPDADGLTVLAQINDLPAEIRPVVIMLTGSGNEQVAVEAMKLGAKDYLAKAGVKLPALRHAIASAMERHLLEERLARSTEELRRRNTQMETELAMAREVQQALLPQQHPVFPPGVSAERSALRFHQRWIPSSAVAGDFFAVFPVGDCAAGILLCDVMGHGVRAALVAALLHGLTRELRSLTNMPDLFVSELNSSLQGMLARTNNLVFVTAIYLVVDAARAEVRFANAGHPHPLHLRRQTGDVATLIAPHGPGPALGMIPNENYELGTARLQPGDSLLVFTDGAFEVENAAGEQYGEDRLRALATANLCRDTGALFDDILAELRAFHGADDTAGFTDDVCLVAADVAQLAPASPSPERVPGLVQPSRH